MPIAWGALIPAVAGIAGDVLSQQGQQSTNQMSAAIAAQNNATAIDLAKNQMTYRVADLKRAGLNPMLAAGGPGMSLPSLMQPNLQNPGQAFSGAGNQITGAMQLQSMNAQIDLLKAQAANQSAQASTTGAQQSAIVDNIKSQTGLNDARATEVSKNVQMLSIQLKPFGPEGVSRYEESYSNDVAQNAIKTHIMSMDQQTQSDTLLSLIKARTDENYATSIAARNIYNASSTEFGRIMSYFHLAAPLTSAVGVAGKLIP